MRLWLILFDDITGKRYTFGPFAWIEQQSTTRVYGKGGYRGNKTMIPAPSVVLEHTARGWHHEHETVGPAGQRFVISRTRKIGGQQ